MYQVADSNILARGGRALVGRGTHVQVSRTVVLLGLTSLFTDISSEMVTTILPLYLIFSLGLSPLQFGVIDGVHQGASSLVRVVGGIHRRPIRPLQGGRRPRLRALGRVPDRVPARGPLLGADRSLVFIDRTGKGIRTAPRDALISLSTPTEDLGMAFGVHRALDTAGAVLGPLIAFGLLLRPQGFDSIFIVSFCFALIGLAVLVLFVPNRPDG